MPTSAAALLTFGPDQAYADSGVVHRIELVWQAETDYAETGKAIPALGHLTDPRDGHKSWDTPWGCGTIDTPSRTRTARIPTVPAT